jgi:hexosaminidase
VNYDWDPGSFAGVPDTSVLGVEGALFGETIPTLADAEYLLLPRLMAIAELGWSPKSARTGVTSPAFQDFANRVASQGARLQTAGLNFFATTQIPWPLTGTGAGATVNANGTVTGTLARLSAPGFAPNDLTATINWGDGHTSTAEINGSGPIPGLINGLYVVQSKHTYHGSGAHTVTVTVTASTGQTGTFTLHI